MIGHGWLPATLPCGHLSSSTIFGSQCQSFSDPVTFWVLDCFVTCLLFKFGLRIRHLWVIITPILVSNWFSFHFTLRNVQKKNSMRFSSVWNLFSVHHYVCFHCLCSVSIRLLNKNKESSILSVFPSTYNSLERSWEADNIKVKFSFDRWL